MHRRKTIILCLTFLLVDLAISSIQYYHLPIDGDLYGICLPAPWYEDVLQDPMGVKALFSDTEYGGAGRYSAHLSLHIYFTYSPLFWQKIFDPITSVYVSIAIWKLFLHLLLLFLLAKFISIRSRVLHLAFVIPFVSLSPLIQVYGLYHRMGIIDRAVTYTFFYLFPLLLFLFILYYIYRQYLRYESFTFPWNTRLFLYSVLIVFLSQFGPFIQALMLLFPPILILAIFCNGSVRQLFQNSILKGINNLKSPSMGFYFMLLLIFCSALIGYLVGQQNTENIPSLSIPDMIPKIKKGLRFHYPASWHFWLALFFLLPQMWVVFRKNTANAHLLQRIFIFGSLFIILYLLLLPFGGYRSYRPMIYRYDTLLPVTIFGIYLVYASGIITYQYLSRARKKVYKALALLSVLILFGNDINVAKANACEKENLRLLSQATDSLLILDTTCPIMGWTPDTSFYYTNYKIKLLTQWHIIPKDSKMNYKQRTQ